jgi:hypothetical protein
MALTPTRQPGGYDEPFSMRSSPTGRRGMANSPKGVLGGSGDRSSARDSGQLDPIFGDGGSSRWGLSNDKKQSNGTLATSSSFS